MVEQIILKWRETVPSVSAFSDNLLVLLAIRQMQAMREPTAAMCVAVQDPGGLDGEGAVQFETAQSLWRAMLDAALAEEPNP